MHSQQDSPSSYSSFVPLMLGLVLLLGLGLRLYPLFEAYSSHNVVFSSADSFYHMRRILVALYHPGSLDTVDYFRGLANDFPTSWPLYYDGFIALLIWLVSLGQAQTFQAELMAACVPPIIGVCAAFFVFLIVKQLDVSNSALPMQASWPLLSCLLFLLMPRQLTLSYFGALDHHAAEVLGFVACLYFLLRRLETPTAQIWPASFALCSLFLIWNGSSIYAGFLGISGLFWCLRCRSDSWILSQFYFGAALFLLPFYAFTAWRSGIWLSYLHVSLFHPLLLCTAGLFFWCFFQRISSARWDGVSLTILLGCIFVLAGNIVTGLDFLFGAGGGHDYVRVVAELKPLFTTPWPRLLELLTPLAVPGPFLALFLLFYGLYKRHSTSFWCALLLLLFCIQSLNNQRFIYMYTALLLPVLCGSTLLLLARLHKTKWKQTVPYLNALMASLFLLGALGWSWQIITRSVTTYPLYHPALLTAIDWLRTQTPEQDFLNPHQAPEYSILAPWDLGHILLYRGQRAVVSENFGLNSKVPGQVLFSPENNNTLLERFKVRYLFLSSGFLEAPEAELDLMHIPEADWWEYRQLQQGEENLDLRYPGPVMEKALYSKLYFFDGVPQQRLGFRGQKHLRLVYESPARSPFLTFAQPQKDKFFILAGVKYPKSAKPLSDLPAMIKIFERVPGVQVYIKLPAGTAPQASLSIIGKIETPTREFIDRHSQDVHLTDKAQTIRFDLSYAQRQNKQAIGHSNSGYLLEWGQHSQHIHLSEAMIQKGHVITIDLSEMPYLAAHAKKHQNQGFENTPPTN